MNAATLEHKRKQCLSRLEIHGKAIAASPRRTGKHTTLTVYRWLYKHIRAAEDATHIRLAIAEAQKIIVFGAEADTLRSCAHIFKP